MFSVEEFRDSVQRIVKILRNCGVRFYVTGGAAAVAFGDPRMTQDVDLVIDGATLLHRLDEFFALLENGQFLFHPPAVRQAIDSGRQFQVIDQIVAMKIDLYPKDRLPGAFDRAIELEVFSGVRLPVASRANLAASKLIWISKGSGKSRRDLRQILRRATAEESASVQELASQLSLASLLEEVLAEPDELDE